MGAVNPQTRYQAPDLPPRGRAAREDPRHPPGGGLLCPHSERHSTDPRGLLLCR